MDTAQKFLMCRPDYFDVRYEINPWMDVHRAPDRERAMRQWEALYTILTLDLGADISLIDPRPGLPDMVFTANAGLTKDNLFIPSRFRFPQRSGEEPHFRKWFADAGYSERVLDKGLTFEGEGDALFYGDLLLAGFGPRTDAGVYDDLEKAVGCPLMRLRLIDGRWYHLDTCLIPVAPDVLAYYPGAFDAESRELLKGLAGAKIMLTEADALNFGGNAVVRGQDVVMNAGCGDLVAALTAHGFRVHETDLSEFIKAGGAAKCLALVLR